MRQMGKITNISIYLLRTTQIFTICPIIFLLVIEFFIDDYVTQRNHAPLNRSSQGRPLADTLLNWMKA